MEASSSKNHSPSKKRNYSPTRSNTPLSHVSSLSRSSRTTSSFKSPCKQCQMLKYRMHDLYENSLKSSCKNPDHDSGLSDNSPFATPKKRPPHSMTRNRLSMSTTTSPIKTKTTIKTIVMSPFDSPSPSHNSSNKMSSIKSIKSTTPRKINPPTKKMTEENFEEDNLDISETSSNISSKSKHLSTQISFEDRIYMPLLFIFFFIIISIFYLVQTVQPDAFIDEFFHVPQSQQYCLHNNFTHWDNKITTPPGLYLSSYLLLKPLQYLSEISSISLNFEPCSIIQHRFTNVVFTIGNLFCLKSIFQDKGFSKSISGLLGLTLAIFPGLFFPFTFLYYTDVGSLFTLLLIFKCSKNNLLVIFFGLISLLFRQTNIVWIFFIASGHVFQEFFTLLEDVVHFSRHEFIFGGFRSSFFRPNERSFGNMKYLLHFVLHFIWRIISQFYGFIFNAAVFIVFLYFNKGIVLGDKSAHEASIHLAQIPYFLTFSFIFALPIFVKPSNMKNFMNFVVKKPFFACALFSFFAVCLSEKFTFIHPYLLADNRHYTFYLWKKFWFRNSIIRFLPIPVYSYSSYTMFRILHIKSILKKQNSPFKKYEKHLTKILFILVTAITIVPQQLIEFRYFIVPFLFWRLNVRESFSPREFFYFIVVNIITISLFCLKSIHYSQDEPNQRIIW